MARWCICVLILASACASAGNDDQVTVALSAHNQVRARYNLPPLRWSPRLADAAAKWADFLISEHRFEHDRLPYGQNLYEIVNGTAGPSTVVDAWASEAAVYDYARNTCMGPHCGHYTQLVWKSTVEVGCASARSGNRQVWVCNYDPPGNYAGERPF